MASKREIERAARRAAMKQADVEALTEKLYVAKRRVFRRTLAEEARHFYGEIPLPELGDGVDQVLRDEARDHAERIARTFNDDLARHAAGLTELPDDQLVAELRRWTNARQRGRAKPTAITEAYSAHADAILSFYRDLGLSDSVEFNFGQHPDDAPPACPICVALEATNPHSLVEVVTIGNPHPGCRQLWRRRTADQRDAPPEVPPLGQTPGGIVGGETLIGRMGGDRAKAVEFVEGLRE